MMDLSFQRGYTCRTILVPVHFPCQVLNPGFLIPQDMMESNISSKSLYNPQKNIFKMSKLKKKVVFPAWFLSHQNLRDIPYLP